MNLRTVLNPLFIAALLGGTTGRTWADDAGALATPKPAKPVTAESHPSADKATDKQNYDAIFSDILKSLPQEKRALVDSAHGAKGNAAPAARPADSEAARKAGEAKRSQALQALPPEVKARVDKAISDLDNRRKQKQAEFKELEK
jgi:hypothetical protein